ncbi:hypothetical protein COCNU_03G015000 [Cocos nucifera]|uniref:Uncharacterized protein n=1 Tax=Cocos nucifera TaxID=13894 RepID=A0A8K0MZV5_COCNU|nr:hypothetical protein COCNU_03G015000 [Cocos nucifera]
MGRRIPYSPEANNAPFFHPVLVLSLAVAWIIASIAVVISLCASCHRKRASSKSRSKPPSPRSNDAAAAEAATVEVSEHLQAPSPPAEEDEEEGETTEIERMPEAAAEHGPILPTVVLPSSTSKRKLSISLSTKLPQKIKSKREKAASEDSIWKKTIILGEKCKVPDDEDEDEDGGNRQRIYHPRTPRSVPVSRNSSFANRSDVPS